MDSRSNSDFYASVAQVIPVLFILLGIEYQLLVNSERSAIGRWEFLNLVALVGLVATTSIGEYAALRTLFEEHATDSRNTALTLTLVALATEAGLIPLVPQMLRHAERSTSKLWESAAQIKAIQEEVERMSQELDALTAESCTENGEERRQTLKDLERQFRKSQKQQQRLFGRAGPTGSIPHALAVMSLCGSLLALYVTPGYWLWVHAW